MRTTTLELVLVASLLHGCQQVSDAPGDAGGSADAAVVDGGTRDERPPEICREPSTTSDAWFTEVTDELGLGRTLELEPLSTGIVAGDLDGDGWQDLIAAVFPAQRQTAGSPRYRFVFMNRPDGVGRRFVDATEESGILVTSDGVGGRGASVFSLGDLDSDGDLDVIACPGSGETDSVVDPCAAFLNDGSAHFTLAPSSDLDQDLFWVPSSVMLDHDEDGILDFWPGTVGRWAYGPALVSRPRFFHGLGDGTFTDASASVGLPSTPTDSGSYRINFGVTSCDLDADGDRDTLLGNYYVQRNYVLLSDGEQFVELGSTIGADRITAGGHTFTMTCGDLDDDGDNDVMLSQVSHPGSGTDKTTLLLNTTAPGAPLQRFEVADPVAMGIARGEGWMEGDNISMFVDVDLDGRKDLFIASSNYPQQSARDPDWTHAWLYRQLEDGTFEDVTGQTPWGERGHQSLEGPAWVDYDHDGDLDLFIGTGAFNGTYLGLRNTMRAYRNDAPVAANWTQLRLVGSGPGGANRSAIGARVTITAGGRTQHQEVLGSWGHSNTQNDVLNFGLGPSCTIDRIEITWPDRTNTVSVYENLRANYPLELRQNDPTPHYLP